MLALVAVLLASPAAPPPTRWLGYQEVTGTKDVPVIGTLTTRNRSWFVAERHPTPAGFRLVQRPCHVDFDRVMGVKVAVAPALLANLPATDAQFDLLPDGTFGAQGWRSGWDEGDVDRDGKPGATVTVEAPMCGGKLYVASTSTTKARAKAHNGGIDGRVQITVEQHILGADGACLKATAEDSTEQHAGWFRLVPAPDGATCADFDRRTWPAAPGR
jgi:hypothetical protein